MTKRISGVGLAVALSRLNLAGPTGPSHGEPCNWPFYSRTSWLRTMNTLSRREEDTLLKTTKARALKECDPVVKGTFKVNRLISELITHIALIRICGLCLWADNLSGLGM